MTHYFVCVSCLHERPESMAAEAAEDRDGIICAVCAAVDDYDPQRDDYEAFVAEADAKEMIDLEPS